MRIKTWCFYKEISSFLAGKHHPLLSWRLSRRLSPGSVLPKGGAVRFLFIPILCKYRSMELVLARETK